LDIGKIEELGWKPKTKFEEGIVKTIKWYEQNTKWWKSIIEKEQIDFHEKFK
jgi:dTDP-glucose 4,6-dehydratase